MNQIEIDQSIRLLDSYVGKNIQVIAFGTSYLGKLQKVDYELGILVLTDGKDKATLDLERIEFFAPIN